MAVLKQNLNIAEAGKKRRVDHAHPVRLANPCCHTTGQTTIHTNDGLAKSKSPAERSSLNGAAR